jgi:hypothetical protein
MSRMPPDPTVATHTVGVRPSSGRMAGVVLSVVAAVWVAAFLAVAFDAGNLAWDVRFAYLPAAENVLAGGSLYPDVADPILEEQKAYVYPPQLAIVLAPLTALPVDLVAVLVTASLIALVLLTLWVLGVRDVRCYAASFLWMPVVSGIGLANLSIPLALALAVAWRYRDEALSAGLALGLAVSSKLLLWPMLVWVLAMRRTRAAVVAVVSGLVVTVVFWAAIGFDGARDYPSLLRRLSEIQADRSYSLVGIASEAGLPSWGGTVLALALGVGLLAACAVLASRNDDARSFTCAVLATLALSPIVWLHYLSVLLVPTAIARPRFSALWLLPAVLLVSPRPGYAEGLETYAPLLVAAVLGAVLLARPTRRLV